LCSFSNYSTLSISLIAKQGRIIEAKPLTLLKRSIYQAGYKGVFQKVFGTGLQAKLWGVIKQFTVSLVEKRNKLSRLLCCLKHPCTVNFHFRKQTPLFKKVKVGLPNLRVQVTTVNYACE
jgi:hypothetical protein